jgi:hypothetical protein
MDKNTYLMLLAHSLAIQNLDTMGSVSKMQERLKKALVIAHGTISQHSALYLIINAIPCILHLENGVGLKIFTLLLLIGLDNVKEGVLGMDSGKNVCIEAYLKQIQ